MPQIQMITAPERVDLGGKTSIFLAGTTTWTGQPDWRDTLRSALAEQLRTSDATVLLNPKRDDWDSSWKENFSDARWAEQVRWELDMQEAADVMVLFFHGATAAPISLLELGLCVRSGRAIVCALDDYSKRGNVQAVCERFGAVLVRTVEELVVAVAERLNRA